ncbi:MAG: cation diffusion facilitator family transporter [Verrucomicrobiota bacterium]|jgi:cation diffusion facilitator family transporter
MSTTLQREGGLTVALSLTVNVIMAGAKLSVGTVAQSQALVADGIHSLVDIAGDIAAIIGLKFAHLPKDDDHPYGHHRFSTLATMLISSLVLLFCLGLAWQSLSALVHDVESEPPGLAAAWVAGAALLIKEGFYQYARRQAERLGSRLLMANATDHRADAIASLLALVAVVIANVHPEWKALDKVVGLVLAGWLGSEGIKLFKGACEDLLDTAPEEHVLKDLSEHILAVPGAKGFHAFRARRLGDRFEVDFHLQVTETATVAQGHAIAGQVKSDILRLHPEVISVLVHVEPDAPEHRKQDGHHGRND